MVLEIIMTCIVGSLLHFTYDWSNHNKIVGLFSAVNESTWEHIKIGVSAIFLNSLVDGLYLGIYPNYFIAKSISIILFIIIIPLIFYTYTAITKKSIVIFDILYFLISLSFSIFVFYKILFLDPFLYIIRYLGTVSLFLIFGLYMILTIMPIKNFLFKDPITNNYGVKGHR